MVRLSLLSLKEIGSRLQMIRKALAMRQKELAQELQVSNATLSQIESGQTGPRLEMIAFLSSKFNVSLHFLLYGQGEMFSDEKPGRAYPLGPAKEMDDSLRELLDYIEESPLVRYSVLSFFRKFLLDNHVLIKKDIEDYRQLKNRQQKI